MGILGQAEFDLAVSRNKKVLMIWQSKVIAVAVQIVITVDFLQL